MIVKVTSSPSSKGQVEAKVFIRLRSYSSVTVSSFIVILALSSSSSSCDSSHGVLSMSSPLSDSISARFVIVSPAFALAFIVNVISTELDAPAANELIVVVVSLFDTVDRLVSFKVSPVGI